MFWCDFCFVQSRAQIILFTAFVHNRLGIFFRFHWCSWKPLYTFNSLLLSHIEKKGIQHVSHQPEPLGQHRLYFAHSHCLGCGIWESTWSQRDWR